MMVCHLAKIKKVAAINPSCAFGCFDPTIKLVRQAPAADEMILISQESGHTLANYWHSYIYDDSAGENIEVYLVDTRANLANPVSRLLTTPNSLPISVSGAHRRQQRGESSTIDSSRETMQMVWNFGMIQASQ
jgi:hypothetical protein